MEANNMNPSQTARSDLGQYCLQCRLPKNKGRCKEQRTKVVTGRLLKGYNFFLTNVLFDTIYLMSF